jgi:hypothetical protein
LSSFSQGISWFLNSHWLCCLNEELSLALSSSEVFSFWKQCGVGLKPIYEDVPRSFSVVSWRGDIQLPINSRPFLCVWIKYKLLFLFNKQILETEFPKIVTTQHEIYDVLEITTPESVCQHHHFSGEPRMDGLYSLSIVSFTLKVLLCELNLSLVLRWHILTQGFYKNN